MMETSKPGSEHGVDYEGPAAFARAVVEAVIDERLSATRSGATRRRTIDMNREDPTAVQRTLGERQAALGDAVTGHSSP